MIWKRVRHRWWHRALDVLRWSRVSAYAMISIAGLISIIIPPESVAEATAGVRIVQYTWAGLMAVAAAFCALGAAWDRWVGEYVGLIPLAAVALVFGVSALTRGHVGWPGGFFLIGFFWILFARWQEVAILRIEAHRVAKVHSPTGEEAQRQPGDGPGEGER